MTSEEQEELVAYLDGELDEEATLRVETRIQQDPTVREELQILRQTWDLLDHLPKPAPSPSFTNQTMERLPKVERPTMTQPSLRKPRAGARTLLWVAAASVLAVVGYFGMAYWLSPPTESDIIRELRVIENYPLYRDAGDLEMLRSLDEPELFGEWRAEP